MKMFMSTPGQSTIKLQSSNKRLGLSDKARVCRELGFLFNDTGSRFPDLSKKRILLYKEREGGRTLLDGLLSQDERTNPIMTEEVMWVECPVRRLRPSLWVFKNYNDIAAPVLHVVPDVLSINSEQKPEGFGWTRLWTCSRWYASPSPTPVALSNVLALLKRKLHLPATLTVEALGDRVFDIHAGVVLPELEFNSSFVIDLSFEEANRPFFDKGISSVNVTRMN